MKLPFKKIIKVGVIALVLWQAWIVGWVLWWKWINPRESAFMAEHEVRIHQWVDYSQIARSLKLAVVAAEDDRFIEHDGFDWEGIENALAKNVKRGKISAGGSTISQQLAKNLFLSGSRSYVRKAHEAMITLWIELLWDKRRILEVYLNIAEWGEKKINVDRQDRQSPLVMARIYGAEMAAQNYFHKSAKALNTEEAARLAVLLPAPRRYGQNIYSPYINRRTQTIAQRLVFSQVP